MVKVVALENEQAVIDQLGTLFNLVNENLEEDGEGAYVHWQASETAAQMIIVSGTKRFLIVVCDLTGLGGQDAV